jgi:predicted transcriptional regulator
MRHMNLKESIMYKPIPMTKMKEGVIALFVDAPSPKPIKIDSPALDVMTDLRKVVAATVSARESIVVATQVMIARRVRLLLVVSPNGAVEGLISARDTMGEKPVTLLRERRGARFEDLIVSDLMVPRQAIDVLDIETVSRTNVGSIIETLKQNGRQHALVVESDPNLEVEFVRGIFSATQIARQLGVPIPIDEVAQTFAEIATALVH